MTVFGTDTKSFPDRNFKAETRICFSQLNRTHLGIRIGGFPEQSRHRNRFLRTETEILSPELDASVPAIGREAVSWKDLEERVQVKILTR